MPRTTHDAAAVEFAITSTSRNTMPADHSVHGGTAARVRSHAIVPKPGALSDSDCIACPHQAGEVVAAPHDIEIDVLTEIEAWVGIGSAEAGRIDVEDDQRRAPPAHSL